MDRFERLLVLLLLRDENIPASQAAEAIAAPHSRRRQMAAAIAPDCMQRLEALLSASRWDAEVAGASIQNAIAARRWLEVCDALTAQKNAGQLRDRKLFAQGGLGSVSTACDSTCGRVVALKEMRPEYARHESLVKRFLLEAKTTASLEHPSIVPVYWISAESSSEPPHYVMRFLEGETLGAAIETLHRDRAANPKRFREGVRSLIGSFLRACEALAYAHSRGVLHRDIKPENIVLSEFGSVFLIDWGLARIAALDETSTSSSLCHEIAPADLTQAGDRIGTPYWMAPEQAAGRTDSLDERTDVYGLGATLFTILTGKSPHANRTTGDADQLLAEIVRRPAPHCRDLDRETSPALDAICAKAMAMSPSKRYPGVLALIDDLQHWLRNEPVSAYVEPSHRRFARRSLNHPGWSMPALIALVGSIVTCATLPVAGHYRDQQLIMARTYTLHRQIAAMTRKLEHDFEQLRAAAQATAQSSDVLKFLQEPDEPPPGLSLTIAATAPAALGFRAVEVIPFDGRALPLFVEMDPNGRPIDSTRPRNRAADAAPHLDGLTKPRLWMSHRRQLDATTAHGKSDCFVNLAIPASVAGRSSPVGAVRFLVDFEPCFREMLDSTVFTEWFALLNQDGAILISGESGHLVDGRKLQRLAPVGGAAVSIPVFHFEREWPTTAFNLETAPAFPKVTQFLNETEAAEDEMIVPGSKELIYVRRFRCFEHEEPVLGIVIRTRRHDLLAAPFDPLLHYNVLTAAAIISSCGIGVAAWQMLRRLAKFS